MKTLFVMVKCQLGQAYKVADEAVQRVEQVFIVLALELSQHGLPLVRCGQERKLTALAPRGDPQHQLRVRSPISRASPAETRVPPTSLPSTATFRSRRP